MTHPKLKEAKEMLNKVFDDTSVSQAVTRAALEDLQEEIQVMLDSLPDPEEEE